MKRNGFFIAVAAALVLSAYGTGRTLSRVGVGPGGSSGHPALSEQEMITPCAACHEDVTPEITRKWFNSRHGIGNVKCFQCHGTYEDFKTTPEVSACAVCHAGEVSRTVAGKVCWDCHPAHGFSVHR